MKIFETAGFCPVTIAAKRHAPDPPFCLLFAQVACRTVLLAFVFTTDRDMPQALFAAHCLESIIVIVEELLLILFFHLGYLALLANLLSGEHPI
jgi:hypothetical protein